MLRLAQHWAALQYGFAAADAVEACADGALAQPAAALSLSDSARRDAVSPTTPRRLGRSAQAIMMG